MGEQVQGALDRLRQFLPKVWSIAPVPLTKDDGYPAYSVQKMIVPIIGIKTYLKGVDRGVVLAMKTLEDRAGVCPEERIVLAGYSQGAMVMHRVLERIAGSEYASRLAGAILLADGDRAPKSNSINYGSAGFKGYGVTRATPRGVHQIPGGLASRTFSVCMKKDPVCDFSAYVSVVNVSMATLTAQLIRVGANVRVHTGDDYKKDANTVVDLTPRISDTIRSWPKPTSSHESATVGTPVNLQLTTRVLPRLKDQVRWYEVSNLPPGLTLSNTGAVSGTPTATGPWTTTYRVRAKTTGWLKNGLQGHITWTINEPGGSSPGATSRVSTATDGTEGDGDSLEAAMSVDGRYITYSSAATNLVVGDTNRLADIFLTDLVAGTTTLVTSAADGTPANGYSSEPDISGDGRYIVYTSTASNLVPNDENGREDVFLTDLTMGTTTRVALGYDGTEVNGTQEHPAISRDGRFISYYSIATNLVGPDDPFPNAEIYVTDRITGATTWVSKPYDDTQPSDGQSYQPSISGTGRFISYTSTATNLVPGDTNDVDDVFLADLQTGLTTRASISVTGQQGNGSSRDPRISADGRYLTYSSHASNLVSGDDNSVSDIFFVDVSDGSTSRLSAAPQGSEGRPAISDDGRYVAFASATTGTSSEVLLVDRLSGTIIRVSEVTDNSRSGFPAIAGDGHRITYASDSATLTPNDTNSAWDVFSWQRNP